MEVEEEDQDMVKQKKVINHISTDKVVVAVAVLVYLLVKEEKNLIQIQVFTQMVLMVMTVQRPVVELNLQEDLMYILEEKMVFLHELVEGLVAEVRTQSKPQLRAVMAVPTEKSGKEDLII